MIVLLAVLAALFAGTTMISLIEYLEMARQHADLLLLCQQMADRITAQSELLSKQAGRRE